MTTSTTKFQVHALPAFTDNYLWLIQHAQSAIIVDPGDASIVEAFLKEHHLSLSAILITHHHQDHIGGVGSLLHHWHCPVFAPVSAHPAYQMFNPIYVKDGQHLTLPGLSDLNCSVMALPGHTLDHIAFYLDDAHLFCGDVLFGAGCGRLFEGTPTQMFDALKRICELPISTLLYPAHEYTAKNIAFALTVDADNPALLARQRAALARLAQGQPTLPTTLALELETNPFLRCHLLGTSRPVTRAEQIQRFSQLRAQRNVF